MPTPGKLFYFVYESLPVHHKIPFQLSSKIINPKAFNRMTFHSSPRHPLLVIKSTSTHILPLICQSIIFMRRSGILRHNLPTDLIVEFSSPLSIHKFTSRLPSLHFEEALFSVL